MGNLLSSMAVLLAGNQGLGFSGYGSGGQAFGFGHGTEEAIQISRGKGAWSYGYGVSSSSSGLSQYVGPAIVGVFQPPQSSQPSLGRGKGKGKSKVPGDPAAASKKKGR